MRLHAYLGSFPCTLILIFVLWSWLLSRVNAVVTGKKLLAKLWSEAKQANCFLSALTTLLCLKTTS